MFFDQPRWETYLKHVTTIIRNMIFQGCCRASLGLPSRWRFEEGISLGVSYSGGSRKEHVRALHSDGRPGHWAGQAGGPAGSLEPSVPLTGSLSSPGTCNTSPRSVTIPWLSWTRGPSSRTIRSPCLTTWTYCWPPSTTWAAASPTAQTRSGITTPDSPPQRS